MSISEGSGVRFGRTVILAVAGEIIEQPVQTIVYAANVRGVMGAGPASSIRFAGGLDVEREAMALAPLTLGEAVITTSGRLAERGIESIIHAVISPGLGEPPRKLMIARAIDATLKLSTREKILSLAIPMLGISAEAPPEERIVAGTALIDAIVAYVRRPGSRLERVIVVSRFEDDCAELNDAIARARDRSWHSLT